MEYPQNLIFDGVKYSILGDNVVQIVLLPNESIMTQRRFIQYHSKDIEMETKQTQLAESNTSLTNSSKDDAAYVGISAQIGKIMVLDMAIFNNYLVKSTSILATTNSLEITNNRTYQSYRKIIFNSSKLMKQQLLFLKIKGTVIEKDLGEGEIIFVKNKQIVAIQEMMTLESCSNHTFVKLKGPGRVLFEIDNQQESSEFPYQKYIAYIILQSILVIYTFAVFIY